MFAYTLELNLILCYTIMFACINWYYWDILFSIKPLNHISLSLW